MVSIDVGGIIIGFTDAFDASSPFNRKDAYWLWACLGMSALDFSVGLPLTGVAWLPYSGFLAVKRLRHRAPIVKPAPAWQRNEL